MIKKYRNAFEALSQLVIEKNWCTNNYCGTCGHYYFRSALKKIAQGQHPDIDSWDENEEMDPKKINYNDPPLHQKFGPQEQERLTAIINECDFEALYQSFVQADIEAAKRTFIQRYGSYKVLVQDSQKLFERHQKDLVALEASAQESAAIRLGSILNLVTLYTTGIKDFSKFEAAAMTHEYRVSETIAGDWGDDDDED